MMQTLNDYSRKWMARAMHQRRSRRRPGRIGIFMNANGVASGIAASAAWTLAAIRVVVVRGQLN